MKTPLNAPPEQIKAETSAKPDREGALPSSTPPRCRRAKRLHSSLQKARATRSMNAAVLRANSLFGKFGFDRIFPWPDQSPEDRAAGEPFLAELKAYLHANVNADEIDRTGDIPQKNIDDLFAMGAFAIKISEAVRRARLVPG